MKIKKFKAKTFTEALWLVKKEFSENAIILSTEEKKGIRPSVEITAAVDYEISHERGEDTVERVNRKSKNSISPQKSSAGAVNHKHCKLPGVHAPQPLSTEFQYLKSTLTTEIKNEIGNLREMIESMRDYGLEVSLPTNKKKIFHFLRERSVREEFALSLSENAKDLNDIPSLLSADIKVKEHNIFNGASSKPQDCLGYKKAIMVIGPTGVGKTTTIAKLSASAIKDGKRVAIINLDTYRIGAVEQVRIYSKIMGIPLSIIVNSRDLKNSLVNFAQSRDIIFIDTSGRNPKDEKYINDLLEISQIEFPIELHLLMSASCDDEFMVEAYRFYRRLPIDYISFTKVDEAVRFGSLYNLLLIYQKPVAYITTGQKVPDDIECVTVNKLINLILRKGYYEC
jgi:flagellar biosynthesis protein FlhF